MGSLTQKSSKSVQYFKKYVKICKFKAKLGAPEYTVVVSSFDQAKHRNQNQVFEDSGAETPRFPERPSVHYVKGAAEQQPRSTVGQFLQIVKWTQCCMASI